MSGIIRKFSNRITDQVINKLFGDLNIEDFIVFGVSLDKINYPANGIWNL